MSFRRRRVGFFFNAQLHQVMHAAPTAIALSRDTRFAVHIVAATHEHLELARDLAAGADAGPIDYALARGRMSAAARPGRASIPPKLLTLALAARGLARFDAIVVPERTSLLLKWMGLGRIPFIHTTHGAGDRAVGYERRIRRFDLVLLAGDKQRRRMLEAGVIREGGYAVVGYPKFDAVRFAAATARTAYPFAERRPTVLYNPHSAGSLSSWERWGASILRQFAADRRYNLIFAPHVKLFEGKRRPAEKLIGDHAGHGNIHLDVGSRRSVDMTYTAMADIYLGDVSSQIYEFLSRPKPCLFLDAHGAEWRDDPNYAHWRYGPVLRTADGIVDAIDRAVERHPDYVAAQEAGLAETFDNTSDGAGALPSERAAAAIAEFLLRPERTGR
ncbi:CDP-glycerol glycerophosphotransferase family protein [uncultured Sphingomonas sp.]|uniref:CDP-glycerol glycerophosphotransferase family protein n=1 Tax=uncultured Sphingomonas sp. TaxID=158754 RepID=UPI0035C9DF64